MTVCTERSTARESRDARTELLERSVNHVVAHGFGDGSLRSIAGELGTSHRMLIYHFGSAQGFWDALLQELSRRDFEAMSKAEGGLESLEEVWERLTTARSLSIFRVLFQLYGEALADSDGYAAFLEQFVNGWLRAIEQGLRQQAGMSRREAQLQARLNLAVIRGLILDLLTTGDRKGTTAALHAHACNMRALRRSRP